MIFVFWTWGSLSVPAVIGCDDIVALAGVGGTGGAGATGDVGGVGATT